MILTEIKVVRGEQADRYTGRGEAQVKLGQVWWMAIGKDWLS